MKTVVVGSQNPVKVEATRRAFTALFPEESFEFVPHSSQSGVPELPFGNHEMMHGATNRADACRGAYPEADYVVGLEGGPEEDGGVFWVSAWMCVKDINGKCGYGHTGAFALPQTITKMIREGVELDGATAKVFGLEYSKRDGSTIGCLTNGHILRADTYVNALIYALLPFFKSELYD